MSPPCYAGEFALLLQSSVRWHRCIEGDRLIIATLTASNAAAQRQRTFRLATRQYFCQDHGVRSVLDTCSSVTSVEAPRALLPPVLKCKAHCTRIQGTHASRAPYCVFITTMFQPGVNCHPHFYCVNYSKPRKTKLLGVDGFVDR